MHLVSYNRLYYVRSMRHRSIYEIICGAVALLTVSCELSDRWLVMGSYTTHYEANHVAFSDMDCSLVMDINEDFRYSSVKNKTHLYLTFYFAKPFEFPSMTLEYMIKVDGQWQLSADTLTVSLERGIDGIEFEYLGSNAKTPTEESMVRNLRSMLSRDFNSAKNDKEYSAYIMKYGNTKAVIKNITNEEMVLMPLAEGEDPVVKKKR